MSAPTTSGRTPAWIVVARVVVLLVVWVALWGEPTVGNLLSGLVVVVVVTWVFPGGPGRLARTDEGSFRPLAALHYAAFFAWALVKATWDVALTVLRPATRVTEAIVAVPLRSRSPVIATMVANSITLTPGTMTVEVDDGLAPDGSPRADGDDHVVLYVHVLGLGDPQSIRDDGHDFERLAVKAFGSAADRERWARADAAGTSATDPIEEGPA